MIKQTTFNEISVKRKHGCWARLLWEDSGRVIIISDYGNWSYICTHRGTSSVPEFLADLDSFYMGKKMLGSHFTNHSDELTIKSIREFILESRKNGGMDKERAIEEWEIVGYYADGDCDYRGWVEKTSICDPWDLGRDECSHEWTSFWNRIWVPLIQPELQSLAGADATIESKGDE
jgi:hypothetical protein